MSLELDLDTFTIRRRKPALKPRSPAASRLTDPRFTPKVVPARKGTASYTRKGRRARQPQEN
jgi:stalled ribosome alternative rescue factor ArfA